MRSGGWIAGRHRGGILIMAQRHEMGRVLRLLRSAPTKGMLRRIALPFFFFANVMAMACGGLVWRPNKEVL